MPTYSKETALYDTGAIAAGIDAAGDTADTYITAVNQNGIKVHAANNVNSNYAAIDATGMEVVRGGTSMAKFGETTRIGEADANRIELDEDGLVQYTEDGVVGIRAGLSSTNHFIDVTHSEPKLQIGEAYWYKMRDRTEYKSSFPSADWPFWDSSPTTGVSKFLLSLRLDGFQDGAIVGNVRYDLAVPFASDYAFNVPGTTFYVRWNSTNQALLVEKMTPDQQDEHGVYSRLRVTYTGYLTVENVKSPVLLFGEHTGESAPGLYAVALGRESTSKGDNAFTSGIATTAASEAQTAIGMYNDNDPDNAFEVGNGTADDARSNALAVSWDGAIESGISGIGATQWINVLKGSAALYVPKDPNGMTSAVGAVTMETSGGGAWTIANYTDEAIRLVYITPANRSAGVNTTTMPIKIDADGRVTTSRDINTTSSSGIFTLGSQITLSSFKFCQRGGVAAVLIGAKKSTATAANTVITVGTITEGRRPPFECAGTTPFGTGDCYVNENGVVSFRSTAQIAANTVFYVRITYPVV